MQLKFTSYSIPGHGRGKTLGFPTINLFIPSEFIQNLVPGIYAVFVVVKGARYKGALYYGSVPTFGEKEPTLEVYLINAGDIYVGPKETVTVELIKYIRGVENFSSAELLVIQMQKDIEQIRHVLK